eukprot:scaffold254959_cov27-Tisochrysis_lutea.AAC.3
MERSPSRGFTRVSLPMSIRTASTDAWGARNLRRASTASRVTVSSIGSSPPFVVSRSGFCTRSRPSRSIVARLITPCPRSRGFVLAEPRPLSMNRTSASCPPGEEMARVIASAAAEPGCNSSK